MEPFEYVLWRLLAIVPLIPMVRELIRPRQLRRAKPGSVRLAAAIGVASQLWLALIATIPGAEMLAGAPYSVARVFIAGGHGSVQAVLMIVAIRWRHNGGWILAAAHLTSSLYWMLVLLVGFAL